MWRILGLLLLTGCDVVFGLDTRRPDARPDVTVVPDAGVDAPTDAPTCPLSYAAVAGLPNRYRVETIAQGWVAAESNCESQSSGLTHLAVPTQQQHLGLLLGISPPGRIWVGIGRDPGGTLDQFRTITNVAVPRNSPLWALGEPNDLAGADRAVEISSAGLNDTAALMFHPYVCECDFLPITPFL